MKIAGFWKSAVTPIMSAALVGGGLAISMPGAKAAPSQDFVDALKGSTINAHSITNKVLGYYNSNKYNNRITSVYRYGCNWYRVLVAFGEKRGDDWVGNNSGLDCKRDDSNI